MEIWTTPNGKAFATEAEAIEASGQPGRLTVQNIRGYIEGCGQLIREVLARQFDDVTDAQVWAVLMDLADAGLIVKDKVWEGGTPVVNVNVDVDHRDLAHRMHIESQINAQVAELNQSAQDDTLRGIIKQMAKLI